LSICHDLTLISIIPIEDTATPLHRDRGAGAPIIEMMMGEVVERIK